jgi:hypothetical protein
MGKSPLSRHSAVRRNTSGARTPDGASPAGPIKPSHLRFLSGLLLLLVGLVFSPVLWNGFISIDDPGYVTANLHVQHGLTWENFEWAFTATEQSNWHPLTWISHMIDCEIFGLRPWGHFRV